MVLGESFEVLPPAEHASVGAAHAPAAAAVSLKNAVNGGLMRHCSFDLYSDTAPEASKDFQFVVVPALDGTAGPHTTAVSLQSVNFPSGYVAIDANSGVEPGTHGVQCTIQSQHSTVQLF